MKSAMEIAQAQIQQEGKGEDACLIQPLDNEGMVKLLAVADGLSLSGGKAAARWAINYLKQLAVNCLKRPDDVQSPRSIYKAIERALAELQQDEQSETTLTCGILRQLTDDNETFLRFEYFAIGDSPIWKVIPGNSKYPFQRVLIHGPLYPTETARVYSTLRLHQKDIIGSIAFGVTEVARGEVLVVCTDGIPEREVFIRDFVPPDERDSRKGGLCQWLFQERKYTNKKLKQVLKHYEEREVLFDDATIIAARLGPFQSRVKHAMSLSTANHSKHEPIAVPQDSNSNRNAIVEGTDSLSFDESRSRYSPNDIRSVDEQTQLASAEETNCSSDGSPNTGNVKSNNDTS